MKHWKLHDPAEIRIYLDGNVYFLLVFEQIWIDNFFIVLIFEIQSFIFVFTIFKIYYWFRKLQVCVWLFSFDFVLSWNGKQLVHPICTLSILCCTFFDLTHEIFVLTRYITFAGWLWGDQEFFIILAKIS